MTASVLEAFATTTRPTSRSTDISASVKIRFFPERNTSARQNKRRP